MDVDESFYNHFQTLSKLKQKAVQDLMTWILLQQNNQSIIMLLIIYYLSFKLLCIRIIFIRKMH